MLRIGYGKPGIQEYRGDSHHPFSTPLYCANNCFWMGLDKWCQVEVYQNCKPPESVDHFMAIELYKMTVQQMLKWSGGQTVWQMNCMDRKLKGLVRVCAVLGENQLVRWSWADAYLRQPYYVVKAKILNFITKARVLNGL